LNLQRVWCTGGWRNGLIFDPLVKYGDYSYAEFMLYPLADALNAVITPTTKVYIAMQVCPADRTSCCLGSPAPNVYSPLMS
jgi:hypothetical protein